MRRGDFDQLHLLDEPRHEQGAILRAQRVEQLVERPRGFARLALPRGDRRLR